MTTGGPGKFCPICKNINDVSALICSHCGALFDIDPAGQNTTIQVDETGAFFPVQGGKFTADLPLPTEGFLLYIFGHSTPIAVHSSEQFIIGRSVPESPGPLVDLAQFDGFALGVSRKHVMIRPTAEGYDLIDLESRNGTWLNDQRLVPFQAHPLPARSELRLGTMKILVLYKPPSASAQKT